jgi:plasmid stabilization system protein ParE
MSFTVVWNPSAESQLAEIWLNSNDRAGISNAVNEIDKELRRAPVLLGESRSGGRRIVITRQLVVFFRVDEADRVVRVFSVRTIEKDQ